MSSTSVRLLALIAMMVPVLLLSGCDDGGSSSGADALDTLVTAHEDSVDGAQASEGDASAPATQTLDLTSNEPEKAAAPAQAAAQAAQPATTSTQKARGVFDLTFKQTHMPCPDCGIQFDSVELVIVHSKGTFTKRQGHMAIKKGPYRVGRFTANVSSIPRDAQIINAKLNMLLNRDEGIANSDSGTVISVHGLIDGRSTFVREITARDDIKGKGYSKANPMVPIDFTDYAKRL